MYENIFIKLLEDDLAPYQRTGSRQLVRKNLRQVPDSHKSDPTLNSKVEDLRGSSGSRIANAKDLNYIQSKYGIGDLRPGDEKELGTTGISVYKCPETGNIHIKR